MRNTLTITRKDVENILHHTHWIAAKNGEQQRFLRENYPGWSMDILMKALIDSKCLVKARSTTGTPAHFSGYQMRANIEQVDISRS